MDTDHEARKGADNSHSSSGVVQHKEDDVPDPDEDDLDGLDGLVSCLLPSRGRQN